MSEWPKEIRPPHVYGNFKVKSYKAHKNSEAYKERPGMSDAHLDCIRQLPCCVCFPLKGGDPHHLKANTGERAMGQKATDKWTVPMCRRDHEEVERIGSRNEVAWFKGRGIADVRELAEALWANTGDLDRMRAVIEAHREHCGE